MALASSSRTNLNFVKEVTFGVTPATTPRAVRFTGESLKYNISKTDSKEINSTRTTSSTAPTDATAGGDVNVELQYAEHDPYYESVLQSAFVAVGTNGETAPISVTFTTTTLAGTGIGTGLVAGQFFTVVGTSDTALDNVLFRCSKSVAPTANLITLDASTPAVAAGPYANTVLRSSRLSNGTTQTSFTIERESLDVSEYFANRGMTPSKLSVNIVTPSLSTATFSFMGKDVLRSATTTLTGTPTASQTYEVMSGVAGTSCSIWAGGVPLTGTFVKSIKLDYDNALRTQGALCTLGSVALGSGNIMCKATLELYLSSGSPFFNDQVTNTYQEIVFTAFDSAGNGYVFTLPRANVTSWATNAGAMNTDMMVTVELTAFNDAQNATAGLRKEIFIDRVGAAVTP